MNYIFYIMGKSSSGKDTIFRKLKEDYKELQSVALYTTRPIRDGEKEGEEYFYVTELECEKLCEQGKVIEMRAYKTVHGIWKYFTVDDGQIDLFRKSYLMIGTLESYREMRKHYGEEALVPIYIQVEDGERLSRALERERREGNHKYTELCRRFLADADDFSNEKLDEVNIEQRFDNIELEKSIEEIKLFINSKI